MTERTGQVAAPSAVALFAVIGVLQTHQQPAVAVVAAVVAVAVTAGLARGTTRGWPLVAGLAVAAGALVVVCHGSSSNLGWFGLCVLTGWCALFTTTTRTLVFVAALVAVLAVQWLVVNDDDGGGAWIAGTIFTAIACVMARRQRDLLDQLREAQAGLADRTRAEERNRIAGEMHDVIGHALTVSLLHVSSARLALDDDPDDARDSLAEAERLARQSLAEVRQAVGMLREHPSSSVPLPGATQLPELVASFRRAGQVVHLDVDGDLDALGTTTGLTVYRIVQESLTNVARHAPSAAARVRLEMTPDRTRVTVENDGGPPVGDAVTNGVGIISMRERAEASRGRLVVGPTSTGWRVQAELPGSGVPARSEGRA
ncbi:MAG: histidine kinase [Aeromicrobium sp.]